MIPYIDVLYVLKGDGSTSINVVVFFLLFFFSFSFLFIFLLIISTPSPPGCAVLVSCSFFSHLSVPSSPLAFCSFPSHSPPVPAPFLLLFKHSCPSVLLHNLLLFLLFSYFCSCSSPYIFPTPLLISFPLLS